MHSNNHLPSLQAAVTSAHQTLEEAQAEFSHAELRYAPPALRLLTNNGAGYEIAIDSPAPEEGAQLVLWHSPSEQAIAPTGAEQLAAGAVTAWWSYPDETTSFPETLTVH
jgi:hypothetical protein